MHPISIPPLRFDPGESAAHPPAKVLNSRPATGAEVSRFVLLYRRIRDAPLGGGRAEESVRLQETCGQFS